MSEVKKEDIFLEQVVEAIKDYPAMAAMYSALGKEKQDRLGYKIKAALIKNDLNKGGVIEDEKPKQKIIIYYPENLWSNEIYLRTNTGFTAVYLFRKDLDFEKQVRKVALMRGIIIKELKFEETERKESSDEFLNSGNEQSNLFNKDVPSGSS